MSSTSSPQRCTHLTMFCAALSAPVTMCTLASRRTPDMPTGSRMPSCASMMNSCGRMCRIFWSAGIATARAASITRSTSLCVTSLSRIATMPCVFRLRTLLPAMPANTEWIWQPAISSASSTARWIDCTVESMLTTTPRFSPREGCEPTPTTSIVPSAVSSPTMATTFDVPMSSPTSRFLSGFLGIGCRVLLRGDGQCGTGVPAHAEAVRVAHVHVIDLRDPLGHHRARESNEAFEAVLDVLPAEPDLQAIRQLEFPCAAVVEPDAREAQSGFEQAALGIDVQLRNLRLAAFRAFEQRQFRRHVAGVANEEFAARVQQSGVVPPGRGHLFVDHDADRIGPHPGHDGVVDPVDGFDALADAIEVHRGEATLRHLRDGAFDLGRRDALEGALEQDATHRTIQREDQQQRDDDAARDDGSRGADRVPVETLPPLGFG